MTKYSWKLKGLSKGLNPDDVVAELETIEATFGSLTPEIVRDAARAETSLLHCLFEWNNEIAGEQYRLQQARTLLNNIVVNTVANGEIKNIGAFEIITRKEGSVYKNIENFNSDDVENVRQSVIRELNYLKEKLFVYNQFNNAISHINKAQELLKTG